jgi:hypothetical protein
MESAVDLDLEEADLQALKDHVAAGFWLRYELIEAPKPVTDKADKKK